MALRTGQLDGRFFPASRADIVEYWSPESLVLANNASVPVWTGRFRGAVAYQGTGANQPTYHQNALNGLPGLYCQNSHWMRVVDPKDLLTILSPPNTVPNLARGYTVIAVYLKDGTASSRTNAAVMGNSQASGNTNNLWLQGTQGTAGRSTTSNLIPTGNSGLEVQIHTQPQLLAGGTTNTDQLAAAYVNGTRIPKPIQGSVSYGVGDIILGSGNNAQTFAMRGTMLAYIIIQRELTYPEVIWATRFFFDKYGVAYPWAGQPYFPIWFGDSFFSGVGTTAVAATLSYLIAMGGQSYSLGLGVGGWGNVAGSGYALAAMEHVAEKHIVGLSGALGGIPIMLFADGYRNNAGGASFSALELAMLARLKAKCPGMKIIYTTPHDYGTGTQGSASPADRLLFCNQITTDAPTSQLDGLVRMHNHPFMGADNAHQNVTYTYVAGVTTVWFSDYIHPGDQGNTEIATYAGPVGQAIWGGATGLQYSSI